MGSWTKDHIRNLKTRMGFKQIFILRVKANAMLLLLGFISLSLLFLVEFLNFYKRLQNVF